MPQIAVEMTSEEARLWAGFQKIIRAEAQMEGGLSKVAKKSREAAKESKELERAAKRVYDQTRTPQEQHMRRMDQLNKLVRTGRITQDTYSRAVRQSTAEMRNAQRAGNKAFGSGMLGQVKGMIAGFVGLAAAIRVVTSALQESDERARESAERIRESRMGLGSLAQLTTSRREFLQLQQMAKSQYALGGAESLDEAARTVFALKSAGALEYLPLFTELKATGLVQAPDVMARSAKTMMASMGTKETGNFRDIVSKAFAASEFSPATAEALLEGAARAAAGGKALGLTDEEILAATAMTATATGSAELGGTQMRSLMKSLEKMGGMKGKNLLEMVRDIESRGLEGEELFKVFGRQEAVNAYRVILQNANEYQAALEKVRQATAEDRVGKHLAMYTADPGLLAARMAKESQAQLELENRERGAMELRAEAIIDRMIEQLDRQDAAPVKRWAIKKRMEAEKALLGPEEFVKAHREWETPDPSRERHIRVLEEIRDKLDQNRPPTLVAPDEDR